MEHTFTVDFIGIGAPKAGTTWLAKALDAHPEICFSSSKATSFFCKKYRALRGSYLRYNGRNIEKYSLFFKRCRPGQVIGEFSVRYLWEETASDVIYRHFPDVKIIAVIREPVSRAISHYRFFRYTVGTEKRELLDMLRPDEALVQHGMYGANLQRYYDRFPRENIKVLIYEEMKASPQAALRDIYAFLGVDSSFVPEEVIQKNVNPTKRVRSPLLTRLFHGAQYAMIWLGIEWLVSDVIRTWAHTFLDRVNYTRLDREPVSDETKNRIRRLYIEDRKKLEVLLGRDLTDVWGEA